jgi:hypothetical protein
MTDIDRDGYYDDGNGLIWQGEYLIDAIVDNYDGGETPDDIGEYRELDGDELAAAIKIVERANPQALTLAMIQRELDA